MYKYFFQRGKSVIRNLTQSQRRPLSFLWICFSRPQALEGQRDGLEHLMRIVKKDKQDLEVRAA